MRYLMKISYCGDDFAGYQRQPGKRTVQSELENAIKVVFGEDIVTYASGRTDAGVHAYGQMVHFDSEQVKEFAPLLYSINSLLPHDVKVTHITDGGDIHARYSAKHKTYIKEIAGTDENRNTSANTLRNIVACSSICQIPSK